MRTGILSLALLLIAATASAGPHRIGGGIHYLRNLGELKTGSISSSDFTKNSIGIIGSYQFRPGLVRFEGDVEYVFDYLGSGEGMVEPSAWALVGGMFYGGAGTGIGYTDGRWLDHAWYSLRAGVDLPLSNLDLDVFASYRFQQAGDLEYLLDDLDSLTFAAILRFGS